MYLYMSSAEEQKEQTSATTKATYLRQAEKMRFEDLDELPAERVTFGDPNYYRYKCRGNWWHALVGMLEVITDNGWVEDAQAAVRVHDFMAWVQKDIDPAKFRTREEINAANDILDIVIAELRK